MSAAEKTPNLFSALSESLSQKCYATAVFYLVLLAISIFLFALPACSWIQLQIMQKFHLKSPSFVRFAALQLVPSMYTFSNEVVFSQGALRGDPFDILFSIKFQINHYPLRLVSFGTKNRRELQHGWGLKYVYLRSRYNALELNSAYEIEPTKKGKIYVRRLR